MRWSKRGCVRVYIRGKYAFIERQVAFLKGVTNRNVQGAVTVARETI